MLECQVLINNCDPLYNDSTVLYSDIFGSEKKQLDAIKLFNKVLKTRVEAETHLTADN